ncbi:MAG: TRAP transporter small permease [Desulfobacteraceae bacterium]|nr:MAG: TRAP transporter small permease [Desulfobacteraceae bacterium]
MRIKLRNLIKNLDHYLELVIKVISVVSCSTLTILLFTSVIFRFVLKLPLSGIDEVSSYSMIWFVFTSGALALKKGAHVGVDILKLMLPPKVDVVLDFLTYLFILSIMLIIAFQGFIFVMNRTWEVTPSLMLPTWTIYIAIPIGAIFMSIQTVILIVSKYLMFHEKFLKNN